MSKPIDLTERCKERVHAARSFNGHPCSRKAVRDGYCKQHHPEAVKARAEARKAESDAFWAQHEARVSATKAAADALRRDAERYRWLRQRRTDSRVVRLMVCQFYGMNAIFLADDEADSTIDEAMRTEQWSANLGPSSLR